MIDSHCHLADEAFALDADAVVERAGAAGLTQILCVLEGGQETEERRAVALAARWPWLRAAVGVHPHIAGRFAGREAEAAETVRAQIARLPPVRAVGEIGLDYHYDLSPRGVQRDVFVRQVALARDLGLPIVVHTRDADEDTIAVLREAGAGLQGVMHCFTGDADMARRSLDLGFYLSFSGIVTFPGAGALRETSRLVPSDRLLVETDAPYLAPVPCRGTRNEPAWVARVVETLAGVRGEAVSVLAACLTSNFVRLFRP